MFDIRQFFRLTKITFVSKKLEHDDVFTLSFTSAKPIHHIAGQHALFWVPSIWAFHVFSLSSSPTEKHITIGTHLRNSRYKRALSKLCPVDKVLMLGPVWNFTLAAAPKDAVFLAQGIGITPFRSMLVNKVKAKSPIKITLIHVADGPHTYRPVTEKNADKSYYPTNRAEFTNDLSKTIAAANSETIYYISGSLRFINSTARTLKNLGIKSKQMKKDRFLGY